MKNFILTLTLSLFSLGLFAQNSNLVLFAEQGERFTAILNGLRINEAPVTHLRITDLQAPTYKLKVIFENKAFGEMDKTVMLTPGQEMTYNIRKNQKGEYVLRFISQIDAVKSFAQPTQTVYVYGNPTPVVNNGAGVSMNVGVSGTGTGNQTSVVQQTTTTQTTQTTQSTGSNGMGMNMTVNDAATGENVNINMNIGVSETGMGMNMNVGGTTTGTTTVTTTTTTSSSGQAMTPAPVQASGGCVAISQSTFQSAKASISSKSFEDSKMTVAKQVIDRNCMTASQIKEVMGLFSFEDSKLEFAKYGWMRCLDPENYYIVNEAFEFESTIEDLDGYTRSNPR